MAVAYGPAGAGKDYLLGKLAEQVETKKWLSYTTRSPRDGEVDGKDYHFVSDAKFRELIDAKMIFEYTEHAGALYGKSAASLDMDVLNVAIMEPFGAKAAQDLVPDAVMMRCVADENTRLNRMIESRGEEEAHARMAVDDVEARIAEAGISDPVIEVTEENIDQIVESVVEAYRDLKETRAADNTMGTGPSR